MDATTTAVELHDSAKFPTFYNGARRRLKTIINDSSNTIVPEPRRNVVTTHALVDEVRWIYYFTCITLNELESRQLDLAYAEALRLASSGLFEAELIPDVCIDEYGEFTFSHQSQAGYVDIGVRGVGELSYHVRNEIDPNQTAYDDYIWQNYDIPIGLYKAIAALREHL